MERLIGQLKGKENELADVYHRAKQEVIRDHTHLDISGGSEELVGTDLMDESACRCAMTSFCRMVRGNVEQLSAHNNGAKRLEVPQIPHYGTIMSALNTMPLESDCLGEVFA